MIDEADEADVRLMIAYRLHFEAANLKAIEIARSGKLGELRIFNSLFTMSVKPDDIRVEKDLGGGPVYDLGIYCINAARYVFQDEPYEVLATAASADDERFREVPEMVSAILRFPDERLATFTCSFGSADASFFELVGTRGRLAVNPAYEYAEALKHELTVSGKKSSQKFPKRDQFAPELIYFSDCVLRGKTPEPSGLEGLADVRIIEAIRESCRSGRAVRLGRFASVRHPSPRQEIYRPPIRKPELVHARPPSEEA
jgi:glucose-fructose oxidoreductase